MYAACAEVYIVFGYGAVLDVLLDGANSCRHLRRDTYKKILSPTFVLAIVLSVPTKIQSTQSTSLGFKSHYTKYFASCFTR